MDSHGYIEEIEMENGYHDHFIVTARSKKNALNLFFEHLYEELLAEVETLSFAVAYIDDELDELIKKYGEKEGKLIDKINWYRSDEEDKGVFDIFDIKKKFDLDSLSDETIKNLIKDKFESDFLVIKATEIK